MGAYSGLDIDRRYDGEPFQDVSGGVGTQNIPAFTAAPPAVETAGRQADAAPPPVPPAQETGTVPPEPSGGAGQKAGDDTADADEKKKAHEAAEARRKAEWEARQAAKKAAEQEQLAKLETMSGEELLAASMKRVSADTEKLTRRNMKECVAEHIQTMCIEDPAFARKVMHPRKSMVRCFQYISRKGWDYVQDELKASGIRPGPGRQAYGCDVPDDLCYQWAVDYFNNPNAREDHEEEKKFVPKPYVGGASQSRSGRKAKADKKPPEPKKEAEKEPAPPESSGQLSLGGFMMREEKAG